MYFLSPQQQKNSNGKSHTGKRCSGSVAVRPDHQIHIQQRVDAHYDEQIPGQDIEECKQHPENDQLDKIIHKLHSVKTAVNPVRNMHEGKDRLRDEHRLNYAGRRLTRSRQPMMDLHKKEAAEDDLLQQGIAEQLSE